MPARPARMPAATAVNWSIMPLWWARSAGCAVSGCRSAGSPRWPGRVLLIGEPGCHGVQFADCEVLEVDKPRLLRYSWADGNGGEVTLVTYPLEPHAGGIFMAQLLGHVR